MEKVKCCISLEVYDHFVDSIIFYNEASVVSIYVQLSSIEVYRESIFVVFSSLFIAETGQKLREKAYISDIENRLYYN